MLNYNDQENWPNNFGKMQSPINLSIDDQNKYEEFLPISVDEFYQLNNEIDDGTTIRLTGMGNATVFNREFSFQQIHFHTPAEHTVNGKVAPFEIHLVHKNNIGQTVVIALLVQIGNADASLQEIINSFVPNKENDVSINLTEWIPNLANGFHYAGSLTTPPLTENVEWVVITNSQMTVSQNQVDWFAKKFGHNNRKCQAINNRNVEYYENK
ncbi:carbonic anhydrase family protein [Apilactobacillus timberlakei]|uniref:carbonic anhydrase n=1 Tax=Apilactobacillus timberlakei TaxID=2008380 RepID=A0ABY2YU40_9LACO|nr:carbonic anhydrase family protein [Apilactobacillus timberlakei]TPR14461.1 carbonic anhydrase family protein [Apilactobacillus timberlakei]TPR14660.1 carbonic anhydrase family protein [Apilactobacillus timberlakei]TPR15987.1 carbonic anhydrase family protein [Apilactobacillus timberlakei]